MVSITSFIKTTVVLGFVLALTTMVVYSTALSTYNYMIPADMGICALREYHLGFFSRYTFPGNGLARLFLQYLYGRFNIPECQFHPKLPVAWINWMDTPARAFLPFHKFGYILAKFQVVVLMDFYINVTLLFFAMAMGVYLAYTILCWGFSKIMAPLARGMFHVICLAWSKSTTGVSFLAGAAYHVVTTKRIVWIPMLTMLALTSVGGFRLAVFITAFGLTLWLVLWLVVIVGDWVVARLGQLLGFEFDDEKRWARLKAQARRRSIEQAVIQTMVHVSHKLMTVDEAVATEILQLFQGISSGEINAETAVHTINNMFKKLARKYHPDRNTAPTATNDMAFINDLKDDMEVILSSLPLEDLPFDKAAAHFFSMAHPTPEPENGQ